ncbi:hypothetical protein [Xanthomonas bonasiae]|uniref:hypothetical protein n=1 Tax=Xanthomonas bonasiae TaxID=2810351 RepID=UPI001784232B|nr:hypothetical protein [Xanthomonas surreyensis]MBD7923494.1 hypothetical protein [Xanthomonas surreyensis]
MLATHHIALLRESASLAATLVQSLIEVGDDESACRLELSFKDGDVLGTGPDFFEALLSLRRQLEPKGLLLFVYGASRNVWPSGMSRSMGLGVKAYRMTKGKQALTRDLVDIFATGSDVEPVTIAEQEQFRNEWFASLGAET